MKIKALFALYLLCSLTACGSRTDSTAAPIDSEPSKADANSDSREQVRTPEQMVVADAPKPELALVQAHDAYLKDIKAPNELVRSEIETKRKNVWRLAVLHIGKMHRWSAYVVDIDRVPDSTDIAIKFQISDDLKFYSIVPDGSKIAKKISRLSDKNQPVYVSGNFTKEELEVLAFPIDQDSDQDPVHGPTCFESSMPQLQYCGVALEEIQPR